MLISRLAKVCRPKAAVPLISKPGFFLKQRCFLAKNSLRQFASKPAPFKCPEKTRGWIVTIGGVVGVSGIHLAIYGLPSAFCHAKPPPPNRLTGADLPITAIENEEKNEKVKKNDFRHFSWRHLFKILKDHILLLIVAIGSSFAVAFCNVKIPALLGEVVNIVAKSVQNTASENADTANVVKDFLDQMKEPSMRLIKLYCSQALLTFSYIYSLSCLGERVAFRMKKDLFESLLRQDIAFFDNRKSGEIVSRLTTDIQEFKSNTKDFISTGIRCLAQTIGSAVSLYMISPEMSAVALLVIPGVIGIGTMFGSQLRKLSRKAHAQTATAMAVGEEAISNIRTVRAFAMEDVEFNMFEVEVNKSRLYNETLGLGIGLFQGGVNLFLNSVVMATLYFGGYLMSEQKLTPGDLMSFLVATQTIQRSLSQMSLVFGHIVKGISAGSRVLEYTHKEATIPLIGGEKIPFHSLFGEIEFRNVHFSYPSRPDQKVLDGCSLRIRAGQTVALVGASGGGKTTMASLLERFYDCNAGSVFIDGIDIKELDPKWLRGQAIGFIGQEPVLFASTILENIRYGRPTATDQEVYEAARAANAHDFITSFPSGYYTVLGERGVTLSGGQKQRVAIARALIKNPSIIVLDEATSALDAESEKIVQEALDTCTRNRTVLVIAHRLSTVRKAHLIAVVANGQIAEQGTHEELKKKGGIYSFLIQQQEILQENSKN